MRNLFGQASYSEHLIYSCYIGVKRPWSIFFPERKRTFLLDSLLVVGLLLGGQVHAQNPAGSPQANELKKMSLEELMDLEITSVSRRQEKLTEVASAIQVITQEDIRRSAATNLPEVLRLTSNLQVAQLNSNAHIISSPGFNAAFSNKLLVMIDGRTVYSPLFAGVFWDAQQDIKTKSTKETQGLLISGSAGSYLRKSGILRYGWRYRQRPYLQGNAYMGKEETVPLSTTLDSQNILARWTYKFSSQSAFMGPDLF